MRIRTNSYTDFQVSLVACGHGSVPLDSVTEEGQLNLTARVTGLELRVKLLESELERLKSLDREVEELKQLVWMS